MKTKQSDSRKDSLKRNLGFSAVLSITLGLTPFLPEPRIIGKIRRVIGGIMGMQSMDHFDLLLHGSP